LIGAAEPILDGAYKLPMCNWKLISGLVGMPNQHGPAGRGLVSDQSRDHCQWSAAPPVSYAVDGKQYIAVGAGGNTNLPFKRGNDIITFAFD
jgi:hypothetical protein